jgi:hypothetical protein
MAAGCCCAGTCHQLQEQHQAGCQLAELVCRLVGDAAPWEVEASGRACTGVSTRVREGALSYTAWLGYTAAGGCAADRARAGVAVGGGV